MKMTKIRHFNSKKFSQLVDFVTWLVKSPKVDAWEDLILVAEPMFNINQALEDAIEVR